MGGVLYHQSPACVSQRHHFQDVLSSPHFSSLLAYHKHHRRLCMVVVKYRSEGKLNYQEILAVHWFRYSHNAPSAATLSLCMSLLCEE